MTKKIVTGYNPGGGSSTQVQSDWTEANPVAPSFIQNKPTLAQSLAAAVHKVISAYDAATGLFAAVQLAYTDLTGLPTLPQTKNPVPGKFLDSYDATTGVFTASDASQNQDTYFRKQWLTTVSSAAGNAQGFAVTTSGSLTIIDANGINPAYLSLATTVTVNTYGVWAAFAAAGTCPSVTLGINKSLFFRTRLGQVTLCRAWLGLTELQSAPSIANAATGYGRDNPTNIRTVAFRFSTNAGDVNWQAYCSDGASSTIIDTGVPPDLVNFQRLRISYEPVTGFVRFYINDVLKASINTTLPLLGTIVAPFASVDNINLANIKSLQLGGVTQLLDLNL